MQRPAIAASVAAAAGALALGGCEGIQSALDPRGPDAARTWTLGLVMYAGGALILLLVVALTAIAIVLPPERRRWLAGRGTIVVGGIVFPVTVLAALLLYGFAVNPRAVGWNEPPSLRIEVIGEQWWWRVRYLDDDGAVDFETANEIRMPVGESVEFILKAADVIHSFWVPNLGGKTDMIPGRVNRMRLEADAPGVWRGQCAEFCGLQHALMAFKVVALPPERFAAWRAAQRRPAPEPTDPFVAQGRELFFAQGCDACHAVRGTPAQGTRGPDLTHVGGRLTIAAGTLPTNIGTLAGWIAASQHLKAGNLMPSFDVLDGAELRALAAYVASLQ